MKVTVRADKCVAAGQCVTVAADVFDQDENNGMVIVLDDSPAPEHHAAVRMAAELCPADVIHLAELRAATDQSEH